MAALTNKEYTIRYATESDIPQILAMVRELATYEKALHEVHATEKSLKSTLSFPSNNFSTGYAKTLLLIPSNSDTPAGMALFFHNYSTWLAQPGIYLEDLFVRPEFRGKGFGTALLRALARECVRLDCGRLEWSVLKWNEPSIKFYEGDVVRAKALDEWQVMRVEGQGVRTLAEGGGRIGRAD